MTKPDPCATRRSSGDGELSLPWLSRNLRKNSSRSEKSVSSPSSMPPDFSTTAILTTAGMILFATPAKLVGGAIVPVACISVDPVDVRSLTGDALSAQPAERIASARYVPTQSAQVL